MFNHMHTLPYMDYKFLTGIKFKCIEFSRIPNIKNMFIKRKKFYCLNSMKDYLQNIMF